MTALATLLKVPCIPRARATGCRRGRGDRGWDPGSTGQAQEQGRRMAEAQGLGRKGQGQRKGRGAAEFESRRQARVVRASNKLGMGCASGDQWTGTSTESLRILFDVASGQIPFL